MLTILFLVTKVQNLTLSMSSAKFKASDRKVWQVEIEACFFDR